MGKLHQKLLHQSEENTPKNLVDYLFIESFRIQLADFYLLKPKKLYAKAVLLSGISSVGKTSITEHLKNKDVVILEQDMEWKKIVYNKLKSTYPNEFRILYRTFKENIISFIFNGFDDLYYKTIVDKNKFNVFDNYRNILYKYLLKILADTHKETFIVLAWKSHYLLQYNKTVVIDLIVSKDYPVYFDKLKPLYLLVYCSLKNLFAQVAQRNEHALQTGKYYNRRNVARVCNQFSEFFSGKSESKTGILIESITQEDIYSAFDKATNSANQIGQKDLLSPDKFIRSLLGDTNFSSSKPINISPRYYTYHTLLRSDSDTPEQLAERLYQLIHAYNSNVQASQSNPPCLKK